MPTPDPAPVELDAEAILAVLNRHGVRYLVIGGFGALLHGAVMTTQDLDVAAAPDDDNLRRLVAAFAELDARLRVHAAEPAPFAFDPPSLRRFTTVTLRTRLGDLDVCFQPDAPRRAVFTYEQLAARAVVVELEEPTPVAALDDIIASKEACGRPKDLQRLPELYRLRDALAATGE